MRSIAKYVAVGALVTPLVIGAAGMASADDGPAYNKSQNSANSSGGMTSSTVSGFTPDGKAYFKTTTKQAGPTGATGNTTGSHS
ncbi:hypothetical protein ABT127_05080 [Streptomyces sp. NPDC001904]|uniref:hypothetical protein n=1 Tax=Streptomyces sp. NPDC001904 TaxID=3154531 RepID=UPI00331E956B